MQIQITFQYDKCVEISFYTYLEISEAPKVTPTLKNSIVFSKKVILKRDKWLSRLFRSITSTCERPN